MQNVKKILIPIDFSPEAAEALEYACALAGQIDAELIALNVVEDLTEHESLLQCAVPPEAWPFFGDEPGRRPVDLIIRDRMLDLWNFIDRATHGRVPQRLKKLIRIGALRAELAAVAQEENIDLIVLKLRKHFLFPNLANRKSLKMIQGLPCPVLLAPPLTDESGPVTGTRVPVFYAVPQQSPA